MARSHPVLTWLLVYLVVAGSMAAVTAHVLHDRSADPATTPLTLAAGAAATPKYLVLMVLDGATPSYLDVGSLPHLSALVAHGTEFSQAFDGILEAETPAGHATIATGSRPDRDGILGFDWATDNNRVSLFSPDQMTALEQVMQETHAPTIAGLYKQAHPHAMAVALSGHKYYAAAPLGGPAADAIIYYQGDANGRYVPVAVPGHTPPASVLQDPAVIASSTHLPDGGEDDLVARMAVSITEKMEPRLLLMNFPEFDWPLGHVYGGPTNLAKVDLLMKGFDVDLGRIEDAYRKAGILDQTLFVVTADHGMMPITRFVPSTLINNAISAAGTTAPDIASNSGDYIWLADASKESTVAANIMATHDVGIQSAYYLSSTGGAPHYVEATGVSMDPAADAANQYLLGALLNGHEPSVVVFGNEGSSFTDPSSNWKGDHGGGSWESQHIPLIISGPGVQQGAVSDSPAQLDDVAPTVLTAMGVAPTGMEGHVLSEALQNGATKAQHDRATEIAQLNPVVSTLEGQSSATVGSTS